MLKQVEDGPAIVACNTCRHSADKREDDSGMRGGAQMVAALRSVRESDARYAGVAVQEMPCLFACTEFCTIHVRAPGKVGYVLAALRRTRRPPPPFSITPSIMRRANMAGYPSSNGHKA
jgi:predicted metal-binding protein